MARSMDIEPAMMGKMRERSSRMNKSQECKQKTSGELEGFEGCGRVSFVSVFCW